VPGFSPFVNVVVRPGGQGVEADSDLAANVDPVNYHGIGGHAADAEGRCTFPALIPGVTYRLHDPGLKFTKDIVARSGETVDVGDVVLDR
jgi:hypothetical protein